MVSVLASRGIGKCVERGCHVTRASQIALTAPFGVVRRNGEPSLLLPAAVCRAIVRRVGHAQVSCAVPQ
jgi:hypothetical protein